jgi:hypothetical protein
MEEGQPQFDALASLFTGTRDFQAKLLPGGAHNFEFSRNGPMLMKMRISFVARLARPNMARSWEEKATSLPTEVMEVSSPVTA